MAERSKDWLKQAERDLKQARNAAENETYEWACFAAQQAAEKAVKGWAISLGGEPWGHSITTLLANLVDKEEIDPSFIDKAKVLDKHYIQTRYPNGFDNGAPGDYYTQDESQTAIRFAEEIIAFCRNRIR